MRNIYLYSLLPALVLLLGFSTAQAQSLQNPNPGPLLLAGGPTTVGDTICAGDSTFVYLVPEPGKSYTWWDAMSGGNQIGTGDTLWTGPLTSTTTYYMQGVGSGSAGYSVGPFDNSIASGSNYTFQPDGLVFSVSQTCTIDTVYVYPNGPGNVVINIENSSQQNIHTATVAVTTTGKTPIPVNYTIAPGTGYRMHNVGSTTGGLFRNTGGAMYPYTSPALNITGAINNSSTFYYKFYDWQISAPATPDPRVAATVLVNPNPTVDAGSNQAYCGNSAPAVTLNPSITGTAGPFDYLWTPSAGLSSATIASPSAAPSTTTTYTLLATDQGTGCKATDSTTVTVPPALVFNLNDTTICFGDAIQLCAPFDSSYTYLWTSSNPNSPTTACILVNIPDTYYSSVTDTLGCTSTDSMVLDWITPNFGTVGIDSSACPTYQFMDMTSGNVTSWLWDFGNGDTAQTQNPTYTFSSNGNYNVSVIRDNGCFVDTLNVPVTVSCLVGVEEGFSESFVLYPNPSSGLFWLESLGPIDGEVDAEIRAADGRLVRHMQLPADRFSGRIALDLGGEAAGVYFLSLQHGHGTYRAKMVNLK